MGRPEGKGLAERKLGETGGNRKGKATPPAVGGERDWRPSPCSITSPGTAKGTRTTRQEA